MQSIYSKSSEWGGTETSAVRQRRPSFLQELVRELYLLIYLICRNAKDKQTRGSRGNAAKIGLIKDELESPELGESVYKDA